MCNTRLGDDRSDARLLIGPGTYTNGSIARGRYTPVSVSAIAVLVELVYATMFSNYRFNLAIHDGVCHFL